MSSIVETNHPVTLVGGGAATEADLHEALSLAPTLVAADGGAGLALSAGVIPEAVIGDFDSITADALSRIPDDRLHRIAEQDSTDFDKALRSISAPMVLAVGFTGARMDHQLAVLHTLVRRPARSCILIGETEAGFLCPDYINLDLVPGEVLSLFPLGPVTGRSTGLRWPIDGLSFDPMHRIGTSNEAIGPVELWMDHAAMIAFVPRRVLPDLMQALLRADQGAPSPARA